MAIGRYRRLLSLLTLLLPACAAWGQAPCAAPGNYQVLHTTSTTATLTWSPVANAVSYDVEYGNHGFSPSRSASTTDTFITLANLQPQHSYDFHLQSVCADGGVSSPQTVTAVTLCRNEMEEALCYWDLHSPSVTCYYGHRGAALSEGVLDQGILSRHTVLSDTSERDIFSEGQLRTIPEGYCYSVRLGNRNVLTEGEKIVYRIQVGSSQSDLLVLRYAIVENNPNHSLDDQPYFKFSIHNQQGVLLDPCLYANFVAGDNSGWNVNPSSNVVWHDWKAVGVDLTPYQGMEIQVHLETGDCALGAHFGYAYFVLETVPKQITSNRCGEDVENIFEAPSGFSYRWYNINNPSATLSVTRYLHVTQAGTYCCWMEYPFTDRDCGFTLTVRAGLRYPVAKYSVLPLNSCWSKIQFFNHSCVATDSTRTHLTSERCESFLWEFDDGTVSTLESPTHFFHSEGLHWARLTAMLANGLCSHTHTDTFMVNHQSDTIYDTVCPGVPYQFYRYILYDSGFYTTQDVCGPHWLFLSYHDTSSSARYDTSSSARYDTICIGDTLRLFGMDFTEAGTHRVVIPDLRGCDSSVDLHLTVHPTYFIRIKDTLPVGEYLTVGDTQFVAPSLGGYTMETVDGCDSTLWVRLSCIKTEDSTVCVDALPMTWDNVTFADEGTDTSYFKSIVGTDSIHVRALHVRQHAAPTLHAVPYCDTPLYYIVTIPVAGYTYRWSTQPTLQPEMQETLDSLVRLHFRPTERTRLLFAYDYADAPSCPGGDTVTIYPQGYSFILLDVQPETLMTDNLHLVARDLGDNVRFRQ
ncbi:MAG: PKD domain-containing protein, partial [Bacteroidales bacterium]|nr:PKD domain-containing protein [Bacteroidales bacterium]